MTTNPAPATASEPDSTADDSVETDTTISERAPGRGVVTLLRQPNLRRLWTAQGWAIAGEALAQIAMPLLVYGLSGSAGQVSFIALLLILPRVILAPIAGLLADRLNRRRLIILADAERLVLVSLVPLAGEVWQIAALAVGIGLGNAIARPAELALVPAVSGPKLLVPALSLIQVTRGIIRVVVPAAGAGVIAAVGPGPTFWLQSACFVGSLLALRKLHAPDADRPPISGWGQVRSMWLAAKREMWAGLGAVRSIPIVRGITASEILWQLVSAALVVTAVVYTQETLDLAARADAAFALMTTSFSAGAVIGAVLAHRIELRLGRPMLMAIGYVGPIFLVAAAFSPPMPVIYAAWFCLGLADAWAVISFQAYLAEAVEDQLRGRVYATFDALTWLGTAGAFSLLGVMTPMLGAPATFGAVGLIVGFGAPLLLWATGALRSIRQRVPA